VALRCVGARRLRQVAHLCKNALTLFLAILASSFRPVYRRRCIESIHNGRKRPLTLHQCAFLPGWVLLVDHRRFPLPESGGVPRSNSCEAYEVGEERQAEAKTS